MIGIAEVLLIAFLAGFIGSILGLGGALILTPVLTYFGIPIKNAIGASMVAIIATSSGSASSYVKDGLSNIRASFYLEVFTAAGAIAGALITTYVGPALLYFIFAAFLGTSFYGLRKKSGPAPSRLPQAEVKAASWLSLGGSYYDKAEKKEVSYEVRRPLLAAPGMLFAGVAAGMLGIGGGAFKTSIQELIMGIPTKVSTATSNFIMGMTALAGASVYFTSGLIYLNLAAPLAIGTTVGSLVGARVLPHLSNKTARGLFLVVLSILIVEMLYKGALAL